MQDGDLQKAFQDLKREIKNRYDHRNSTDFLEWLKENDLQCTKPEIAKGYFRRFKEEREAAYQRHCELIDLLCSMQKDPSAEAEYDPLQKSYYTAKGWNQCLLAAALGGKFPMQDERDFLTDISRQFERNGWNEAVIILRDYHPQIFDGVEEFIREED